MLDIQVQLSEAMTQATDTSEILKQLDKLTTAVESVQSDIRDIKLSQARTEERIKSLAELTDQRFSAAQQQVSALDTSLNKRIDSFEQRGNGQETRFWSLVAILATTLLGILGKVVFFPIDKL
jgi:predicted nuclease with TOPRIM domain